MIASSKAKQFLLASASLLLFTARSHGQMAVIDAAHIAHDEVNQLMNYVTYVDTQVNTLNQYEQQVIQLARLGNPAAIIQLAGLDQLAQTVQSVGAVYGGVQQLGGSVTTLRSGVMQLGNVHPGQIFDSLKGSYVTISATGTTAGGTSYDLTPSQYVYEGVVVDSANTYSKRLAGIGKRQTQLTAAISATLQNLDGAQTEAEVHKYTALLQAQNSQLLSLGQQASQAADQAVQQQAAAGAAEKAQARAQAEKNAAEARDGETKAAAYFTITPGSQFNWNSTK